MAGLPEILKITEKIRLPEILDKYLSIDFPKTDINLARIHTKLTFFSSLFPLQTF